MFQKVLNDPDYCDGVASHPELDILECKAKQALRNSAVIKASGCDEISAERFRSLEEDAHYQIIALISCANKVMLKILHTRLQYYANQECADVQGGFRKGRGTRDQIANIWWIIEKAREFQKNIYLYFIDCAKAFDYVDHDKLWKALREMGIPDHLTCLLRNLYAGQEATVRTLYRTTDWFKIEKGVRQDCLLSPCLLNAYAEHIMRNAGLDEL